MSRILPHILPHVSYGPLTPISTFSVVILVVSAPVTPVLFGLVRAAPVPRGLVNISATRFIMNSFKIRIVF